MSRTSSKKNRPFSDGIIKVDSKTGKALGFTSDKFEGDIGPMVGSYLWKDGNRILVSLVTSVHPGQGNLSKLFATIESKGYRVAVPTPLGHMQQILEAKGFKPHWEKTEVDESCEVWEKPTP